MGILDVLDHLPEAICQPSARLWSVFARSLGEQGASGRTALAWRWALTGECPSPVTLSQPPGRPPARSELLAEAVADAELAGRGTDPGGQVMHARFVLQWLAGDLDALPLWNGGNGSPHITDGVPVPRSHGEMSEIHSWALLAQWRNPWPPADPSDTTDSESAAGYARGATQLLAWTLGMTQTGPLTGATTTGSRSLYQVALEVRYALAGLDQARNSERQVLVGRIEGVIDSFTWLAGWDTGPPVDRHGHLSAENCPERSDHCKCRAAETCLSVDCPACVRARCVHGFAQLTDVRD